MSALIQLDNLMKNSLVDQSDTFKILQKFVCLYYYQDVLLIIALELYIL